MAARPVRDAGLRRVLLILLFLFLSTLTLGQSTDPRSHFHKYAVVYPAVRSKTDGLSEYGHSVSKNVMHEEMLTVAFVAFGKPFVLDLFMNKNLLPVHYFEKHHENGKHTITRPMEKQSSHCYYQGHMRGVKSSWAALSTCKGISGVIYDGDELHYIQPDSASKNNSHLVFRALDMRSHNFTCGFSDQHSWKPGGFHHSEGLQRHKRSAVLQEPYKTNSHSRFVELVLVNDNKEFKKFNQSKEIVFERSKQIANIVNGLYAPLNIFIALVGVIIWSEHDEIKLSTDGDVTLTNFLHYRRERLAQEHPNDNAQLITAITFDGGVVGKALKGPMCTFEYSGGVNMDHSDLVGLVATTVAHELGHNFGMEHDTDECQCSDERCIMAPSSSSTSPRHWSSCSLDYLAIAYTQGMDYCLKNRPKNIIGPVCGNSFLEEGEECDCGLKEFCDNPCCNASTCRLFPNASCATGACCDIKTCQVKKIATPCRKVMSECDLPEYCDGKSEFCPADTYKQNGLPCGQGKAFCYDGKCRSHADQCKILWGQTGKMSDSRCYEQNHKGNVNGNCGYNRLNKTYKACNKQDILCGMLHCTHLNERLEFGMESAAILARSFINVRGKVFTCRSAIVDLGLSNTDPGLAPNGAKCGEEKMCVDQKCVSVEAVTGSKKCPFDCNGNGVCNNHGHCHCEKGYGPPYCNTPGSGGSIDSGPISDTGVGRIVVIAMYIIFLGLVPLVIISACSIYHFRSHLKTWWITKARKANIKCRAKQTIQRKPQLPPKFNFDRNSLRTLEISAPIQQGTSNAQTGISSNSALLLPREKVLNERLKIVKVETPGKNLLNSSAQNKPIPIRPAPPRPDSVPQRSPSWTPATAAVLPNVVRTASLRIPNDGSSVAGRPVSISTSRPSCPPPRPPPPKPNSPPKLHRSLTVHHSQDQAAVLETERSATPSSTYYDDCQTLDFSNTPLAFVHQTEQHTPTQNSVLHETSSQNTPECTAGTVQRSESLSQKSEDLQCNSSQLGTKPAFQRTGRTGQSSLVQSLAKKFENQKFIPHSAMSASQIRPPFKSRPLPPPPNDSEV